MTVGIRVWDDTLSIFQWQSQIHAWAVEKGFWEGYEDHSSEELWNEPAWVLSKLMLATGELGEAAGEVQRGNYDATGEEIADCIIRLLDTAHALNYDMAEIMARKMQYNETRPYKHGKRV